MALSFVMEYTILFWMIPFNHWGTFNASSSPSVLGMCLGSPALSIDLSCREALMFPEQKTPNLSIYPKYQLLCYSVFMAALLLSVFLVIAVVNDNFRRDSIYWSYSFDSVYTLSQVKNEKFKMQRAKKVRNSQHPLVFFRVCGLLSATKALHYSIWIQNM